jgi:dTDP-glucose pyrophosphorylase
MYWKKHIVQDSTAIKDALQALDGLGQDTILFVTNHEKGLVGALTDGDIRRGLLNGVTLDAPVIKAYNPNPKFILEDDIHELTSYRKEKLKMIPIVDKNNRIIDIINFRITKTKLPVDVVIMAGGKGRRLQPLTMNTPKPLLNVGTKPIIEHLIDQLAYHGMNNINLSIHYLGEQLEEFAKRKSNDSLKIKSTWDKDELGTIGSLKLIKELNQNNVIVCNSDLLTNVDYEKFFFDFIDSNADLSVLSVPYTVNIPYAVLKLEENNILDLKEKPSYTYYSNGGIYLMKRELLKLIPDSVKYSATDLIEKVIQLGKNVRSFQHEGYWLDIGRIDDYNKANRDIASGKIKR